MRATLFRVGLSLGLMTIVIVRPAAQQPGAPPPPPPTALILGRVVDASTGKPIGGATVTMNVQVSRPPVSPAPPPGTPVPIQSETRRVTTGTDGQFVFHSLPRGSFTPSASAPGYLGGATGRRRPGGPTRPVDLDDGERDTDVVIKMWRYATVTGTVTDESGEPAVNIGVRLLQQTTGAAGRRLSMYSSAQTDDRGMYRFSSLTPGEYLVVIPQSVTSMPVLTLDAYNNAMQRNDNNARQELERTVGNNYELGSSGLRVGTQQIQMNNTMFGAPSTGDGGRVMAYRTLFYPAADSAANATTLSLESGAERTGVDLQMRLTPAVSVSGTITGPDGPVPNLTIRIAPAGANPFGGGGTEGTTATTATDPFGQFTFPVVPTGQYVLGVIKAPPINRPPPPPPPPPPILPSGRAMPASPASPAAATYRAPAVSTEPTLWAEMPLVVGEQNLAGVNVSLRTGLRVRGRFVFEGSLPVPRADGQSTAFTANLIAVGDRAVPLPGADTVFTPDGQFTTPGVPPGRYTVAAGGRGGLMAGWTLKSISHNGRVLDDDQIDVADADLSGVTVTFTDKPTDLSGTVAPPAVGQGELEAVVIVFPADFQAWVERGGSGRRMRNVSVGKSGAFRFGSMPPGDYVIAAIGMDAAADPRDLAFYRRVAAAGQRFHLGDGEKRTISLSLGQIK